MLATGTVIRQLSDLLGRDRVRDAHVSCGLVSLIANVDFTALAAPPFTGVCPAAYDGVERIYLFASADGPVALAGCQVEIDHAAPLIALVDTIVGTGQPGVTGSVAPPVPVSSIGYLEGRRAVSWRNRCGWTRDTSARPPRTLATQDLPSPYIRRHIWVDGISGGKLRADQKPRRPEDGHP